MNYLDELVALIPPPAGIKPHTEAEWAELEAKLGSRLPTDYKGLINKYGSGYFCTLLIVLSPFRYPGYFASNQEYLRETVGNFGENPFKEKEPATSPVIFTFFPEPGGLLYFTTDELNGFLCWKTKGAPEDWTIVIANDFFWMRQEFSMSLTEFILRFAKNEIMPEKYTVDEPMEPTFDPFTS